HGQCVEGQGDLATAPASIAELGHFAVQRVGGIAGVYQGRAVFITQDAEIVEVGFQIDAIRNGATHTQADGQAVTFQHTATQTRRRYVDGHAILYDVAAPHRIAGGVANVTVRSIGAAIAVLIGQVQQGFPLAEVVAYLALVVVGDRTHRASVAEPQTFVGQFVVADDAASDTCRSRRDRGAVVEYLRLRVTFQAVVRQVNAGVADLVAKGHEGFVTVDSLVEAVGVEALGEIGAVEVELAFLRDGRFNQYHTTHGVAAVLGRKGAIQHF